MMKKLISMILIMSTVLTVFTGCGATKIVHCDNCGAEIKVSADSNVNDDWTLYCDKCNKELGIEDSIMETLSN